jgi:hypothetical protein
VSVSEPLSETYTFLKGAVYDHEFIVVSAVVDELKERSPAQLYAWLGDDWYDVDTYGWTAAGLCCLNESQPTVVCVSEFGEVATAATGGIRGEEVIESNSGSPRQFGKIRCVREIGGLAYAAGMGRQVYKREAPGSWVAMDQGTRRDPMDKAVVGFEGIDGYGHAEIYAAGWKGEIWQYDGQLWMQQISPTNQILTDLCCGGDGWVYACGRQGMLIRGRGDRWQVIEHESTIEDFWSMSWYNDKLYLATTRAVYALEGDVLERVDFGEVMPATCYYLASGGGVLCSIGQKDIILFDGQVWRRLD